MSEANLSNLDELVLVEVTAPKMLESIYALRVVAWRSKVEIPDCETQWIDDIEPISKHWAVLCGDRVVAAARLSIHELITDVPDPEGYHGVIDSLPAPIGSMNRCVVHPDFRGRGLSKLLDQTRIAAARNSGCRSLIVSATDKKRAAALAGQGFKYYGTGPGIPYGIGADIPILVFAIIL